MANAAHEPTASDASSSPDRPSRRELGTLLGDRVLDLLSFATDGRGRRTPPATECAVSGSRPPCSSAARRCRSYVRSSPSWRRLSSTARSVARAARGRSGAAAPRERARRVPPRVRTGRPRGRASSPRRAAAPGSRRMTSSAARFTAPGSSHPSLRRRLTRRRACASPPRSRSAPLIEVCSRSRRLPSSRSRSASSWWWMLAVER